LVFDTNDGKKVFFKTTIGFGCEHRFE
jgi:hypothetical protein